MIKWIEKHDVILKILCVLISILIWIYVTGINNEDVSGTYKNIDISLLNEEKIMQNNGLIVVSGQDTKVSVKLSGKRTNMVLFDENTDIRVTADVSVVSSPGVHNILYNTVVASPEISVISREPQYITIEVDEIKYSEIPIYIDTNGSPKKGYFYGSPSKESDTITIYGASKEVAKVKYAKGTLYADNLSETSTIPIQYDLYDQYGNIISSEFVYKQKETFDATLPVTKIVSVPIEVSVLPTRGIKVQNADINISPKYINITGEPELISSIQSVNIATVPLSEIDSEKAYTFGISLPDGVVNVDNLVSANVSVKLTGIETGEVKTDNISINYDGNLYSVELITKNINVRFKGDKNEISTVTGDDISLYVNFSDEYFGTGEFSEGFHKIDATVVVDESKDVVPIDEYYVILKITSANSDEPAAD